MIEMPVCIHNVPIKFSCWLCKRKGEVQSKVTDYYYVEHMLDQCFEKIEALNTRADYFASVMHNIALIERESERALDLFVRKAHDLKKIDAKRDDVIDSLCQKIELCFKAIEELKDAHTRR